MALIIPKRIFAGSAAAKEFIDTARAYWDAAKRPSGAA
jgi:hypothetical protein